MAKISVIVPVYKVEAYLDRCAASVLSQSFEDFELILVDDGSPDNCPALCDGYGEKDRRVHVIHQKNGGLSAARNAGLDWVRDHSQSRWVFFLDSDDWIHRDTLRRLLTAAEETGAEISAGEFLRIDHMVEDPELPASAPHVLDPETAYVQQYAQCMNAWGKLIRRDLLQNFRFPVGKLHEDAFVTHLLVFACRKLAFQKEPFYYYYFNPDSITRKSWKPRRLEELEGHGVRLDYLKEHGLQKAYDAELETTIHCMYEHIEVLARCKEPEFKPYRVDLCRKLRKALKKRKDLVPLDRESVWLYLAAYRMMPLWHLGKKAQDLWHCRKGKA